MFSRRLACGGATLALGYCSGSTTVVLCFAPTVTVRLTVVAVGKSS